MELFKKFEKYKWILPLLAKAESVDRNNLLAGYKGRKQFYTSPLPDFTVDLKAAAKCATCPNMCRFDCPALLVSKRETFAPAHKARISLFLGMDRIDFSTPMAINALYACMKCDVCRVHCPMDISTGDILIQMRGELESRGLIPSSLVSLHTHAQTSQSIFKTSPFVAGSEFDITHAKPEVFLFLGCMDLQHRPRAVRAVIALLRHLQISFTTAFADRGCCGGPLLKAGYRSDALQLARQNAACIKASKASKILTLCPGCSTALETIYSDLKVEIKSPITHAVPFFWEKVQAGILKCTTSLPHQVVYHDPCLISRPFSPQDCTQITRQLLQTIPDLKVVEPLLHGHETRCCGMGGAYAPVNPEFADRLHGERLNQLLEPHPTMIVSGCPTCEYSLHRAMEGILQAASKSTLKIVDIVELLADACGLDY